MTSVRVPQFFLRIGKVFGLRWLRHLWFAVATLTIVAGMFAFARNTFAASRPVDTSGQPIPITTEIVIPGSEVEKGVDGFVSGKVGDLAGYIGTVYMFLISIVGLLSGVMILFGGFQYLTAGGDAGRVKTAKNRIANALLGMTLALGSYVILNTINPNLVKFKVPTITPVKTELRFIPFCDQMIKQMGITENDIINNKAGVKSGARECGAVGWVDSPSFDSNGKKMSNRTYCIWRGTKRSQDQDVAKGIDRNKSQYSDWGCSDTKVEDGALFKDTSFAALSICLPVSGISSADLDKELEEKSVIDPKAECQSCVRFTTGRMQKFNLPIGDKACEAWQNTANNGSPTDTAFSLKYKLSKGIIQDTRKPSGEEYVDDHTQRMYYCGYSTSRETCVYVPIGCQRVARAGNTCEAYENQDAHWCDPDNNKGVYSCNGSAALGDKSFGENYLGKARYVVPLSNVIKVDEGLSRHLIPVCSGDPCDTGKRCQVPGLAGLGEKAAQVRAYVNFATRGLLGDIDCEAP